MTTFKSQTSAQSFALMFFVITCREPESPSWSSVTLAKAAGYRKAARPSTIALSTKTIGSLRNDYGNDM